MSGEHERKGTEPDTYTSLGNLLRGYGNFYERSDAQFSISATKISDRDSPRDAWTGMARHRDQQLHRRSLMRFQSILILRPLIEKGRRASSIEAKLSQGSCW